MPAFWNWFIAIGTIAFTIANVWLIMWSAKQGPQNVADDDVVGHVWDGDIEERNYPAPKWWLYLYYMTIVWAVGYMIAYPSLGVGAYQGALGWSQLGQYEAEMQAAAEKYEPIYERFAAMDFAQLQQNPDALQLGKSLFASYCTTCHGSDARGATGYPNLADNDWLWGDSETHLTTTISNGRSGVMPVLAPALGGEAGINNMTSYVRSLSGLADENADALSAKPMFLALCSACHNADGSGNQLFGAPNLTDDIWLYGSSEQAVRATITEGRSGVMPPHGELLGAGRTKILAAYVASLSQQR
jgi:cytochrome c oxidase cbb3-type subunit 3